MNSLKIPYDMHMLNVGPYRHGQGHGHDIKRATSRGFCCLKSVLKSLVPLPIHKMLL